MNEHVKHKSRRTERSPTRHRKKKKSRKRSSSSSQDCIIVTSQKNICNKEKKRKSRKKKRHRSSSSDSSSSDSSTLRLKLGAKPKQLLGERPEFCRNTFKYGINSRNGESLGKNHHTSTTEVGKRAKEHENTANSKEFFRSIEHRVGIISDARGRKRDIRDRLNDPTVAKKSKKSRKRKRSSSCSSSTSCSSSSRSSSLSSSSSESRSSSSSSSNSSEKRRKRKKKKKLAKKMKREEKRRKEEKRKLKKLKEKIKAPIKEIKRGIEKAPPDRLLKDINMELADRSKDMAPMTREQWEKKQSVIRRVYDGETGRHRLIKGDGEVLEEIVSRDRHMAINRQATKGDGQFFQSRLAVNK